MGYSSIPNEPGLSRKLFSPFCVSIWQLIGWSPRKNLGGTEAPPGGKP